MTTRMTTGELFGTAARAGYATLPPADLLGRYLSERDEAAFRELVGRYAGVVSRACRGVLGRDDLARDAFQETFLRLVRHGHALRRRGGLAVWLARVARTTALNLRRREARQRRHAMATAADPRPTPPDPLPADEAAALWVALGGLPDRFRLPLELVYLEGLTHAEAAARLDQPKGTVDSNVSRGLGRLRAALGPKNAAAAVGAALPAAAAARPVPAEWVEATVRAAAGVAPRPPGLAGSLAAWWSTRPVGALAGTAGVVVGIIGLALGVAALAGWPATRGHDPEPAPPPPAPPTPRVLAGEPAPPVPETLPARNLRLFAQLVRPKLTAALNGLRLGDGGEARITGVETEDSRVFVTAEIGHGPEVGFTTRVWIGHDMYALRGNHRDYWAMWDVTGSGRFVGGDPRKGLRLLPGSTVKRLDAAPIGSLADVAAAFDRIPPDDRSIPAKAALWKEWEGVLSRSAGRWIREPDGQPCCTVGHRPPATSDGFPLVFRYPPLLPLLPDETYLARWLCVRPRPDGRVALHGVHPTGLLLLSADGSRIEVPAAGEVWARPKGEPPDPGDRPAGPPPGR